MNFVARKVGGWLSRYLSKENKRDAIGIPNDLVTMRQCLQQGDVVLSSTSANRLGRTPCSILATASS
jgi:tRNA A37 threonylcarbamoyladenosine synthetase subunit TsaC/SUA5/YrdC